METQNTHQPISPPPINPNSLVAFQTTHTSQMKPIFRRRATIRCSTPSSLTYITKYRPKLLSTIELVNLELKTPNFKTIRAICQSFKDTKKASSLKVRKDESNSQNLRQLKHLLSNTHLHWKKVSISYINSDRDEHLLFHEAAEIATRLRRYRDLSNLAVYISCTKDLRIHILPHLFQQLKGLRNLKAFNLDFKGWREGEEATENYEPNAPIFTFKYPKSLKHLRLNLQESKLLNHNMLSTFASNVSHCNFLTDFHFNCNLNSYKPPEIQTLAPLFEKVQSLKSFNIRKFFAQDLQLQDGIDFIKGFECMKHLIDLDLFIFFCLPGDAPIFFAKSLFKYIGFLTNLKSLKLHLLVRKYSSQDDNPDEDNLFLPLQSLIRLQTLSLSLRCYGNRELPGLQSLSQGLQSLHNLKKFELISPDNKISHSHFISLSDMFKNLTSLQTLNLIFYEADLEPDSLQLLSTSISHLKLLIFTFNIRDRYSGLQQDKTSLLSDQNGLTPFFSALSGLTSLIVLNLNLSVFILPAKELQSLSLALKEMKQLCCLSLEIPEFDPDPKFQCLKSLISSIKEMSKLALLELIFKSKVFCDEEVELVASSLSGCYRSLKGLELNFHETKELTARSVLVLQNALQNLSSLKKLTLDLGPTSVNVLDEKTVCALFETLSYLRDLEIITMKLPPQAVPLDFDGILRKFAGHWNLNTFTVNQASWLKSVDRNQH